LERAWQKVLQENENVKDQLRHDIMLLKESHERVLDKERRTYEVSLEEAGKMHRLETLQLKDELYEAREEIGRLTREVEKKTSDHSFLYADYNLLRQRLDTKMTEVSEKEYALSSTSTQLQRSQSRLQLISREETSMRRQAAEMAALNLENEGKMVELSNAYEEAAAENEKLRRQVV
jgi:hypothetical protein